MKNITLVKSFRKDKNGNDWCDSRVKITKQNHVCVKATQNSTSTTDKTVGYVDRSQWVGRWLVKERKEEDKASPLFSFSQILVLLLVINNSILNI